jgi:hypothetical protein
MHFVASLLISLEIRILRDVFLGKLGHLILRAFLTVLVLGIWPLTATAQDAVYVQVEAQPTLSGAQARARVYAGQIENVNGYLLGGR